jgi:ABC-type nitrate/sulfonate/bicarbonate transport system substrate-binding protein
MGLTRRSFALAGLTALSGVSLPDVARAADERLILGSSPGNSMYWDLDVGIDKGFFKNEGFAAEIVVPQSSPQVIQLLVTGSVQLAASQPEPLIAAIEKGATSIGAIASPMNFADWSLSVRPDIQTLADLKGKVIGVSALKNSECWQTAQLLAKAGLKPGDYTFVVAGTSPSKIVALEKGSISAAILFQPSGQLAETQGLKTLAYYADLRSYPSILYAVNREWAAKNEAGKRLSRALTRAHEWLHEPQNRAEAIAILQKATKRDEQVLGKVYDIYFTGKKLYSPTGAIEIAGLDRAIADMASDGDILKAPTPASKYLIAREHGGLWQ